MVPTMSVIRPAVAFGVPVTTVAADVFAPWENPTPELPEFLGLKTLNASSRSWSWTELVICVFFCRFMLKFHWLGPTNWFLFVLPSSPMAGTWKHAALTYTGNPFLVLSFQS